MAELTAMTRKLFDSCSEVTKFQDGSAVKPGSEARTASSSFLEEKTSH